MKKQLLLFVMMVLPFMASAHNDGTELEVTYQGSSYSTYTGEYQGNVVIPEEVTYMNRTRKVTSIGNYAFYNCSGLTSVTIPNSVTSIGDDAFRGCSGLTSITIPNSVTSIGDGAFQYCYGLTSITIPNSVTSIGSSAFQYCSGLTSITIPNSVTGIGYMEFYGCSGLTSITIPNSVTSIGYYAFQGCSSLTSITIPNSVTSIGNSAFEGCSGLTSIIIPNSVLSIKINAFNMCRLQNVVAKNSKTSLSEAFSQGTFNHAILYIPVGKRWDFVYDGTWYLFANMKEMVTETSEINEQNAYMLMNAKSFEYMVYDEVNDEVRCVDSFYNVDENVASNNWQFVNIDGEKCLYNIKAKKYASISLDGKIQLQSLPTPLYMTNGNSGIIVNGNNEVQYNFVVNDKMAIDQNPTGIQTLTIGKINQAHYYDLNGQKLTGEPTKKGIYINNGQKIIVK